MSDEELIKRVEQLERQRSKTLRFSVLLAAALTALTPAVIMLTAVLFFEIDSTIESGKPQITHFQSRKLPDAFYLQMLGGVGAGFSAIGVFFSQSERLQRWLGLRVKDED